MLLDPEQMIETSSNTAGNSVAFQYSAPRILCRKSYSLNGPKPARFRILRNRLATRFTLSGLPVRFDGNTYSLLDSESPRVARNRTRCAVSPSRRMNSALIGRLAAIRLG